PPDPPAKTPRSEPQSAVFQRGGVAAPRVRQPDSPWNLALGMAFAVLLGVIVFATLSAGRPGRADNPAARPAHARAPAAPAAARPAPAGGPPPPRALAPATPPVAPPVPAPVALPTQAADAEQRRLHAPVMVVDLSDGAQAPAAARATAAASAQPEAAKDPGG